MADQIIDVALIVTRALEACGIRYTIGGRLDLGYLRTAGLLDLLDRVLGDDRRNH